MTRFNFIVSCCLSIGLHAGALWLIPVSSLEPLALPNTPTDAELLVLDIPMPSALQVPTEAAAQDSASAAGITYDATKIMPLEREKLDGAIEKLRAGMSVQLPLPALQLPVPRRSETGAEPPPPQPADLSALTTALLEQSLQAPGVPSGQDQPIGWGEVRLGEKQIPSRLGLPTLDQRLTARALPDTASPRVTLPPLPQFGIQGPAARREPLYRPTLPQVQVQAESEITLKFWVRPDGVVSRVLPERKGEAALEVAAIRYLEGWRFTPLPSHEPQVEQWGTITIRFLLRER
jgi:TonB family protein